MNEETLLRFIHQIVATGSNGEQSVLALQELSAILQRQGVDEAGLALIEAAIRGLQDSGMTMIKSVSASPVLSADDLKNAVLRAHEQKLREEEAQRNGRC